MSEAVEPSKRLSRFLHEQVYPRLTAEQVYQGVTFRKSSAHQLRGPCPLHGGRNPNFTVGTTPPFWWRCWSACGTHGDAVDFIMKTQGLPFRDAIRSLAELANVDTAPIDEAAYTPEATDRFRREQRRFALLDAFVEHCVEALQTPAGDAARQWLEVERGLKTDALTRAEFGLCVSMAEAIENLTSQGFDAQEIQASGVRESRAWAGRIVAPIRDRIGRIVTIWGRPARKEKDGEPKYLYLGDIDWTQHTPLAGLREAFKSPDGREGLVLVEGVIDVALLQARGFLNVAAIGGNGLNLSGKRLEAIRRMGVKRIITAMDNDDAGHKGTAKIVETALKLTDVPMIYVIDPSELGDAKDPDELVRKHGLDAFRDLVATKPVHMFRYRAADIIKRHKRSDAWSDAEQDAAVDEALAFEACQLAEKDDELRRHFRPVLTQAIPNLSEDAFTKALSRARLKQLVDRERKQYEQLARDLSQASDAGDVDALKSLITRAAEHISQERSKQPRPLADKSIAAHMTRHVDDLMKPVPRMQTGWPRLDKLLAADPKSKSGGFAIPSVVVLGAEPKIGKSTWSQIVAERHVERGGWAYYLDLENGRQRHLRRLLYRRSKVSEGDIERGLSEPQRKAWLTAWEWWDTHGARSYLEDQALDVTPAWFDQEIARLRADAGPTAQVLVVVDSLQKLPMADLRERRASIDEWLRMFEHVSNRHNVVILAISELKRPERGNAYSASGLAFKESGDIEYTAGLAITMTKGDEPDAPWSEMKKEWEGPAATLKIVYNRDGRTGSAASYRLIFPYHGMVEDEPEQQASSTAEPGTGNGRTAGGPQTSMDVLKGAKA